MDSAGVSVTKHGDYVSLNSRNLACLFMPDTNEVKPEIDNLDMGGPTDVIKEIESDASGSAIIGSFIFWLSSVITYMAKGPLTNFSGNQVVDALTSISALAIGTVGAIVSILYLLLWPLGGRRAKIKSRAMVIYLAGLI